MSFVLVSKISLYCSILRDNLSALKGLVIDSIYSSQVHTSGIEFCHGAPPYMTRNTCLFTLSRDSEGIVGLGSTC